ncbi:hypothetical protein MRB53_037748 [Persea americana]|nr:hypothetical protein MRB53_037748 [Persea americana]
MTRRGAMPSLWNGLRVAGITHLRLRERSSPSGRTNADDQAMITVAPARTPGSGDGHKLCVRHIQGC